MEMDLAKLKKQIININLLFVFSLWLNSCNTYDKLSLYNRFSNEGSFIKYKNDSLGIQMLLYGDFEIANTQEEYENLPLNKKQIIKKKVVYGQTYDPPYYFNISLAKRNKNKDTIKEIFCKGHKSILAISKKAPQNDVDFLIKNFRCTK